MIQPAMFADVVSCESCPSTGKLLRDRLENVPQPGFTGSNYSKSRVLLTGQNPGVPPPRMLDADKRYTAALRALRDRPSTERQREFDAIVREFVPTWPVHGAYFPLQECGLTLDDIAYCNVVRCRTVGNATPSESVARECVMRHFERWARCAATEGCRVRRKVGKRPRGRRGALARYPLLVHEPPARPQRYRSRGESGASRGARSRSVDGARVIESTRRLLTRTGTGSRRALSRRRGHLRCRENLVLEKGIRGQRPSAGVSGLASVAAQARCSPRRFRTRCRIPASGGGTRGTYMRDRSCPSTHRSTDELVGAEGPMEQFEKLTADLCRFYGLGRRSLRDPVQVVTYPRARREG
jgi:hypothetical protein